MGTAAITILNWYAPAVVPVITYTVSGYYVYQQTMTVMNLYQYLKNWIR